jgi:hypothetical protein
VFAIQWRKYCFGGYADQLRAASLGLLDEERDGQQVRQFSLVVVFVVAFTTMYAQIDRQLVKNFVDLLNDLQVDQVRMPVLCGCCASPGGFMSGHHLLREPLREADADQNQGVLHEGELSVSAGAVCVAMRGV